MNQAPSTAVLLRRGAATAACVVVVLTAPAAHAGGTTPAELLAGYTAQAGGTPPSAERGQKLFNTPGSGDLALSCASCHTDNPAARGRNAVSDKRIDPLAPAANPKRFTDRAQVEGWFRNNCQDVFKRACTAAEKADIMAWLMAVKP